MKECKHPTCGEKCRRPVKEKKTYILKRTPIKKKPYKMKKVADSRVAANATYKEASAEFRKRNPSCAINSPECTKNTQGVHHMKGKQTVDRLLDETFWMPACNRCNNYIEIHDAWARERGFKLSKFN